MSAQENALLVQQATQLSVAPVLLLTGIEVYIATHTSHIDVLTFEG